MLTLFGSTHFFGDRTKIMNARITLILESTSYRVIHGSTSLTGVSVNEKGGSFSGAIWARGDRGMVTGLLAVEIM